MTEVDQIWCVHMRMSWAGRQYEDLKLWALSRTARKCRSEIQGFLLLQCQAETARLEVHTRLRSTDYIALMQADFLVSGLLCGILVWLFKKDNDFFSREHISSLGLLAGKSGPEGQQKKLESSAADIQIASGATWDNLVGFWSLFCFALVFLPQLVLPPLTQSPQSSGSRGVRSHLCTCVHCTLGVSSLVLSIVWSALTQHTIYSLSLPLHRCRIHQSGWLRGMSSPIPTGRNKLKQLILWRRLGVMLPGSTLHLLLLGRERNTSTTNS